MKKVLDKSCLILYSVKQRDLRVFSRAQTFVQESTAAKDLRRVPVTVTCWTYTKRGSPEASVLPLGSYKLLEPGEERRGEERRGGEQKTESLMSDAW